MTSLILQKSKLLLTKDKKLTTDKKCCCNCESNCCLDQREKMPDVLWGIRYDDSGNIVFRYKLVGGIDPFGQTKWQYSFFVINDDNSLRGTGFVTYFQCVCLVPCFCNTGTATPDVSFGVMFPPFFDILTCNPFYAILVDVFGGSTDIFEDPPLIED